MSRSWSLTAATALIAIATFSGCVTPERITHRSQLRTPVTTGPITVLTTDSLIYRFTSYELSESTLHGTGTVERGDVREPFDGDLQASTLLLVQTQSVKFGKGIFAIGVTAIIAGISASSFGNDEVVSMQANVLHYSPQSGSGGGGSSCPYVYSWNGVKYQLDAESFGVAFGKALEMTTVSVLPSLQPDKDTLKLLITNELPETHFINAVGLMAVEADRDAEVVADADGALWPVVDHTTPRVAQDNSGRDILREIGERDAAYWESDAGLPTLSTTYQDTIDLVFGASTTARTGSLVISALNTELSSIAYRKICAFLGDRAATFTYYAEHDSGLTNLLRGWIDESSLHVSLLEGHEWKNLGTILPEATEAPFSRLVRFTIPPEGDSVKIRLISLKDVWKIDRVSVDYTPADPLQPKMVDLQEATGADGKNVSAILEAADDRYVVLLPPDKIQLRYRAVPPSGGKKTAYALLVRGYLHEWNQEMTDGSNFSGLIPGSQRIGFLKNVLRDRNSLLPLVYAEWAKLRK